MVVTCVSVSSLQYKVLLYSLDGRLLSTYSAYEWSLGVKSVTWSPSSQFLAIGSFDEKVCTVLIHSRLKRHYLPQDLDRFRNNLYIVMCDVCKHDLSPLMSGSRPQSHHMEEGRTV